MSEAAEKVLADHARVLESLMAAGWEPVGVFGWGIETGREAQVVALRLVKADTGAGSK